jgi:dUTP pyrophosphatase
MKPIQFKKLRPDTLTLEYATGASAAVDLRAAIDNPLVIEPGAVHLIPTGLAIYIGDADYAALIVPRSGLGHKHGLILGNGLGLIDADYQGQLFVSLWNRSDELYTLQPLERMTQLIILPIARAAFEEVQEFTTVSDRKEGGFGSTGKT